MAATPASKSAAVRARLNHPVIDSDGHTVEFLPAVLDYVEQIGGTKVVEWFKAQVGPRFQVVAQSGRQHLAGPRRPQIDQDRHRTAPCQAAPIGAIGFVSVVTIGHGDDASILHEQTARPYPFGQSIGSAAA